MVAALAALLCSAAVACASDHATSLGGSDIKSRPVHLPSSATALPHFDFTKFEALGRELTGTPTVMNIWASGCGPCRKEAPELAAAARHYAGQVQFIGNNIQDRRQDAADFIMKAGWAYPSLFNPSGDIRDGLGFVGQPETLFYDANGDVAFIWIGPLSQAQLSHGLGLITEPQTSTHASMPTPPSR